MRFVSQDGAETYVGILWLRHFPAGNPVVTHTKRVGVAVDAGSQGKGFLIGYENLVRIHPPPDNVLNLDYDTERGISFSIQNPSIVQSVAEDNSQTFGKDWQ